MNTEQLDAWRGEFGCAYTDRNVEDWRVRLPVFTSIVEGFPIRSALEVGCNRGHNLIAFANLLGEDAQVVGIEPNRHAQRIARASSDRISVLEGNAYDLPFKDGTFDLVFTAGVLIHVSLADLPCALSEIHRVSKRHILALEYFAEEETVIPYRGNDELLWKRNFLKHYQMQFPDLQLRREGFLGPEKQSWDSHTWWLLEKSRS